MANAGGVMIKSTKVLSGVRSGEGRSGECRKLPQRVQIFGIFLGHRTLVDRTVQFLPIVMLRINIFV